ncbi:hypothetical protein EHO61_05280 [Leptospira fluminis]|uniref:Uncharacterized protein n=1 Tax=Leptospira fluminis TaxID=2484979 RepID=A0A4R9GT27_9LEPT|nr:hypothetical protein [Leptospira fluminis]TGK20297.1 hypothetical protein EHO61_05280 [Leptospira fluminis]
MVWNALKEGVLPEKSQPTLFRDKKGGYFLGEVGTDGLIKKTESGYRYSIRDGFVTHWAYVKGP